MQTAILESNSNSDLKLLIELAKKTGIKAKILKESELEDLGLALAVKEGRTSEYLDTNSYLNELRK